MIKTCSLETSRKLYETGLRIETEKWWCKVHYENLPVSTAFISAGTTWLLSNVPQEYITVEKYPAPSTDELLEVLQPFCLCLYWANLIGKWVCAEMIDKDPPSQSIDFRNIKFADTSSEALGKMALYLLEHDYKFNSQTGRMETR